MKRSDEFVLRNVADEYMLIPIGEMSAKHNGIISLNPVSLLLWEKLSGDVSKEDLIEAVLEKFDAPREVISVDIDQFLDQLRQMDMIL